MIVEEVSKNGVTRDANKQLFVDTIEVSTNEYLAEYDSSTHRYCGACQQLLPLCEFYKDGKDNHGNTRYRRDCKNCYKKTRFYEQRAKDIKKFGGKKK